MAIDKKTTLLTTEAVPQEEAMHRYRHEAMACDWGLYIACAERSYGRDVAQAVFEDVDRIECELSAHHSTSDVSRINTLKCGESTIVGMDTLRCLQAALEAGRRSAGAFDVFYKRRERGSDSRGTERRESIGRDNPIHFDLERRTVTANVDRLFLDLGGIGKGYAIDAAIPIILDWSIDSALLHSGESTLYALGMAPCGKPWRIKIRHPLDFDKYLGELHINHQAVSGSGRLRQGEHIVDPSTGKPADRAWGVWVIAESATLADALSTAFMLMTPDEIRSCVDTSDDFTAIVFEETDSGVELCMYGREMTIFLTS